MISEQVKKGQYSELYVNPYSRRYKLSRLFGRTASFIAITDPAFMVVHFGTDPSMKNRLHLSETVQKVFSLRKDFSATKCSYDIFFLSRINRK